MISFKEQLKVSSQQTCGVCGNLSAKIIIIAHQNVEDYGCQHIKICRTCLSTALQLVS